ncbi:MAG: methionine synthase [Oscillospiraceae bacterium]|nr:methionine synthase [Oscillospiraceae bacterium]
MEEYKIDRAETLRYLGYRGQEIDLETLDRLDRMTALCLSTAKPKYTYERFGFEFTSDGVRLLGADVILRGGDLRAHLTGARELYLCAATLGHDCDRLSMRLEARSIADAVVFNAASVSLIEDVSNRAQAEINESAEKRGLAVGGRYSPGYGDFPLTQQRDVLRLLRAEERLGITLTDGCLMLPRKSVTGVIGLYEDKPDERVSCAVCSMRDWCEFRKGGDHCG